MKRQYVIGGIIGAVAVTALSATAGVKLLGESAKEPECRDVVVEVPEPAKDPDRVAGTLAGAVVGGVVGNQIGDGSGRDAATVAGAVAGGVAGNKIQKNMQEDNVRQEVQRVCE